MLPYVPGDIHKGLGLWVRAAWEDGSGQDDFWSFPSSWLLCVSGVICSSPVEDASCFPKQHLLSPVFFFFFETNNSHQNHTQVLLSRPGELFPKGSRSPVSVMLSPCKCRADTDLEKKEKLACDMPRHRCTSLPLVLSGAGLASHRGRTLKHLVSISVTCTSD